MPACRAVSCHIQAVRDGAAGRFLPPDFRYGVAAAAAAGHSAAAAAAANLSADAAALAAIRPVMRPLACPRAHVPSSDSEAHTLGR